MARKRKHRSSAKCARSNAQLGPRFEWLEHRRLLTFTVNGTPGDDTIEMMVAGGIISVTVDGVASSAPDGAESAVIINGLDGHDTIRINSTGDNTVAAMGGAGNDTFTFAEAGGLISAIAALVSADGGTGANVIRFFDSSNTTAGNSHYLNAMSYDAGNAAPVTYSNFIDLRLYCGDRADTVTIDGTANASSNYIRPNRYADVIFVNQTGVNSFVTIEPSSDPANGDYLSVGTTTGTAQVSQQSAISLGAVVIGARGRLNLKSGGATTLSCGQLTISPTGILDLADNAAVVRYGASPTPFETLRSQIISGYNAGAWDGNGIRSSTAGGTKGVGIIESSAVFPTYPQTFAGAQVTGPSVLVRQTHHGDTNLDRYVNVSDFSRLATNFNRTGKRWLDGDFDFNGVVNTTDFNLLAVNFGTVPSASQTVPTGVSATSFGAIPNDGLDDTAAIQAAIESLPVSNGTPIGNRASGGVVLLPAGTFNILGPIRVKSGVKLQGVGAATLIYDTLNGANHAAVELYSPFSHRWNTGASIESLTIYSQWGSGVRIDPGMLGDLVDFRMSGVRVSAQGVGIDLRASATYHSDLDDVEIYNPGSTALHTGNGADIRVRNLRVTGAARSGFVPDKGLVMITSDVNVYGMTVQTTGAPVVPLYISGQVTMTDVDMQVPAANCPGGVAVSMEMCARVAMDSINNIGLGRRIKLVDAHDVQIQNVITDGTANTYSLLMLVDSRSYARVANNVNGILAPVTPPTPGATHTPAPVPAKVVDVREFGAIPDDGIDDTAAIQIAIDSLPLGDGMGTSASVGGIVQFPLGVMTTTAPLRLPSGVWLRGQENGSIIDNYSIDSSRGAIELISPFSHGNNVGAGIEQMGISTIRAAAIKSDTSIWGELKDLHIAGVRVTAGGVGVDFRNVVVSYLDVDRIIFTSPGTTAMWIGKTDNSSHDNIIRGVRMAGYARPNFVPERALWVVYGKNRIEGGSIEDTVPDHPVLPFYGSGSIEMYGLYMEFPAQPGGYAFAFENASSVKIDRLYHINSERRISFNNVAEAEISNLNIDGTTVFLQDCIYVDTLSHVTIQTVNGQMDSGMLDHPMVTVNGFYNGLAQNFVETRIATGTPNLLKDPDFTSVGDDIWNVSDWQIAWADGYSGRLGTFAVETFNGVKRLRIDAPNTVNVGIRVRLNVNGAAIGRAGIARWRIDGPSQAFVYTKDYIFNYPARAMNSMTAARTVQPLAAGDEMWIVLPNAHGTYYLSQFGMVAT